MTLSPDIPTLATAMKGRILPWAHTNLGILSEFYEDGQWHFGDENTNWYVGSPCFAALCATMYRWDNTLTTYRDMAIATTEASFTWNLDDPFVSAPRYTYNANPNFPLVTGLPAGVTRTIATFDGGPWGKPDPIGSDEAAQMEAGSAIAWILDMLWTAGAIDQPTALRWLGNLKLGADWLIDYNGNPIWYTNGNYVAHQMLFYAHLAKMCRVLGDETGFDRYSQAYEQTMLTLLYPYGNNPPANAQWSGYGYIVGVAGPGSTTGANNKGAITVGAGPAGGGTTSDGSGETGWLSETPSYVGVNPSATWDGVYSQLQMDLLATIFVVNRDWRVNYLLNAIWNKLETITNFTTYLIDCTGGSRQTGVRGWTGGYQNTIALLGRRISDRTNITNAVCTGAWDNQIALNITAQGTVGINQLQSSQARLWRINVATSLHACNLVAAKLS